MIPNPYSIYLWLWLSLHPTIDSIPIYYGLDSFPTYHGPVSDTATLTVSSGVAVDYPAITPRYVLVQLSESAGGGYLRIDTETGDVRFLRSLPSSP